jgi:hypothetical protein
VFEQVGGLFMPAIGARLDEFHLAVATLKLTHSQRFYAASRQQIPNTTSYKNAVCELRAKLRYRFDKHIRLWFCAFHVNRSNSQKFSTPGSDARRSFGMGMSNIFVNSLHVRIRLILKELQSFCHWPPWCKSNG